MLIDILLVILVCLYAVLYIILLSHFIPVQPSSDNRVITAIVCIAMCLSLNLFFAGDLVSNKHFAFVSGYCMIQLIAEVIINGLIIGKRNKK